MTLNKICEANTKKINKCLVNLTLLLNERKNIIKTYLKACEDALIETCSYNYSPNLEEFNENNKNIIESLINTEKYLNTIKYLSL